MSLIKAVVALVKERGPSTMDDLTPLLPEFTREQIGKALKNAKAEGWVAIKRGAGKGGKTGGTYPSTYTVRDEREPAMRNRVCSSPHRIGRVASVWKLARV